MFDIGWQELFVLAVLAIIVIGPKDLPRAIRTVTHWIRKARGMARDLQDGLDDVVREAELDDIKKQANSIMSDELDPANTIARELDMTDVEKEWSKAVDTLRDETDPDRSANTGVEEELTFVKPLDQEPAADSGLEVDSAPADETTGENAAEITKAGR